MSKNKHSLISHRDTMTVYIEAHPPQTLIYSWVLLNEDFCFVPTLNGSSIHRLYCIRLRANLNIHVLPQQNNSTWHIYIQTRTRFEQGPRRGNSHHQERFLWFIDTGTCRTLCSILHHCDITPGLMISVHYFSK